MNAPRDLGPRFRAWIRDVPPAPADLEDRVLRQTRQTRQRRRWLWFLPGRKPTAGASDEQDRVHRSAAIREESGRQPAPTGGISTMFSPAKLAVGAAILALVGGVISTGILTSQPADQPAAGALAFESDATLTDEDFIPVSGTHNFNISPGRANGFSRMDDPRVSGFWDVHYEWLCKPDESCVSWGPYVVSSDGGTWEGQYMGFSGPGPEHDQNIIGWANGTGDYEGWSYVVSHTGPAFGGDSTGILVHAPLPDTVEFSELAGMLEAAD
jgi:hypothetical protein